MLTPFFLKPGDTVGLVSPAGKIHPDVVQNAERYLAESGFSTLVGKHALDSWHQFAGEDEFRAEDFNEMLRNPKVKAIWCTRGGYGAIRLVGKIDFEILKTNPKWLIGFSDITIFHSLLRSSIGMKSIHGAMPINFEGRNPANSGFDELFQMLQSRYEDKITPYHPLNRIGEARGQLIGGNLTILHGLIGTALDFEPKGKVLFIEEVGEYLYHLDRMLHAMKLAGKFNQLSGLVVGQITEVKDNLTPFGASGYEIIKNVVEEFDFPVLFNFPSGHSNPNMPLMLGAEIKLEITNSFSKLSYV